MAFNSCLCTNIFFCVLHIGATVVRPGRAFLRRLIDLTIGIKSQHHFIRVSKEVKKDLNLWLSFLSNFNGKSFFIDDIWQLSNNINLFTDASGALGFGAVFGNHWCYGKWPDNWVNTNIAILEFYPIVLSLHLWGADMSNRSIIFYTDNEALVHVINKQSCKDKTLMVFVRRLVLLCLQFNIMFKAKHVPGAEISTIGSTNYGPFTNRHICPSAARELVATVASLVLSSLQPSSRPTYRRAWKLFEQFHGVLFQGF